MTTTDIRYARHFALREIGEAGQRRLAGSAVLIVGLGGLGSAAAMYLAASGVGRLLLNDFDVVDPTNLQRQLLYRDADVGRRKTEAADSALGLLNPGVERVVHDGRLDAGALAAVLSDVDIALDCSDNFGTRFALNTACQKAGVPLVSGAAVRLDGQVMSFPPGGPCYACLFSEQDETLENCAGNGVLAPLVGVIGALQAVEAMRLLVGMGEQAAGRMVRFDAASFTMSESRFGRDPECEVCG